MQQGFSIGPLYIHYYGILVMLGALAGTWLASTEARRKGLNPETPWDVLPWLLIGGIIGARLWHILLPPKSMVDVGITAGYYFTHPLDAIAIWRGGLGIPGAVIGGVITLYIYTNKKNLIFAQWLDVVAPGIALGQAIGRWGNYVNQEIYGAPTSLPWGIFIEPKYRLPEFNTVEYYHPLFLYESLWNLLNMGILLYVGRRFKNTLKNGDIFLLYLIIYPVGRFFLEFLRLDNAFVGLLNFNQSFMGIIAIGAAGFLFFRHWHDGDPVLKTDEDNDND
jgi:phosphatidylglycerol---prolipoprotein diacylglyceryl transferase